MTLTPRDLTAQLHAWKNSSRRKPLILQGARQVGKTHIIKSLGAQAYQNLAYFNFETDTTLKSLFDGRLEPELLIKNLAVYAEQKIEPGKTLIFFDEIQSCGQALNSLKFFNESANQYHIAAAGSLLGVTLSKENSFPVGKVNFLKLNPLSFPEFLNWTGHAELRKYLKQHPITEPVPETFHLQLINILKIYYYVGGMPEAVASYAAKQDFVEVREIHNEINKSYLLDFAKHAPATITVKLQELWENIPVQLARESKKFIFSAIKQSARGRGYTEALHWLQSAGLVHKVTNISGVGIPLQARSHSETFKIYSLDVGLLSTQLKLTPRVLLEGDGLFAEYRGALAENYVLQELVAADLAPVFYWTSEGTAEVDFVIEHENYAVPLEVKAGTNLKQKSLLLYQKLYSPKLALRASLRNFDRLPGLQNLPLYAVERIREIADHLL